MPTFTASNSSVSALASEIVTSAMLEAGIIAAGEPLSADDGAWGLAKIQRDIDGFNAREALIFNVSFEEFTLIANHSPLTIGPGGDFDIPQRPVRVISSSLVLTSSSPNVDIPMAVKDDQWWADQRIKSLTSTLPTHLYYSQDSPLGKLNFWPIPTEVNDVRLEIWTNLTQAVTLATAIAMPP